MALAAAARLCLAMSKKTCSGKFESPMFTNLRPLIAVFPPNIRVVHYLVGVLDGAAQAAPHSHYQSILLGHRYDVLCPFISEGQQCQ